MSFSSCNHPLQELLQDEKRNNYEINFSPSLEPNDEKNVHSVTTENLVHRLFVCFFVLFCVDRYYSSAPTSFFLDVNGIIIQTT